MIGWKINYRNSQVLQEKFNPKYANVIADHITWGMQNDIIKLPAKAPAQIIGICDDDMGVEALVLEISGSSKRPDGKIFHITWSLADGRKPVESNDAIAKHGWNPIEPHIPITLGEAVVL